MSKVKIIHGDCREVIPTIPFKFDFIFADPPFNIGQKYKGFEDSIDPGEYSVFTIQWITACCNALRSGGVLCLHGPDAVVELYLRIADSLGFAHYRIAWINWHYRFGQCNRSNWIDARCHCLVYSRHADYTWNPDAVLVESDRVGYGDKRIGATANGGKRLPFTVWGAEVDARDEDWEVSDLETARPIPRFPKYFATWAGLIVSRLSGEDKILSQRLGPSARYLRVCVDNQTRSVHELVCAAFNGPKPEPHYQVRHLDDIKTNNRASNLIWGTAKENGADKVKNGKSHRKLTDENIEFIQKLLEEGNMTQDEIAEMFGVVPQHISKIKLGQRRPGSVFGIKEDGKHWGRVQGNNTERRGDHPNQLPEVYLERLIKAYTNPGDRVLDPFCGSGTTATVAAALGRHCVTIDVSEENCISARERVAKGALRL